MPTMKQVKEQIAKLPNEGRYIFFTNKEVRCLPKILEDQEPIYALTSGYVGNSTWLLVVTDRRILFLDCGMIYGLKQIQMPLNRINSIDHEIGIAFGTISIWDGATRVTVGTILRSKIDYFVRAAKKAMEIYNYRMAGQFQQQMPQQQFMQQNSMMPYPQQPIPQPMMQQPVQPQKPQLTPEQIGARMGALTEHLQKLAALRDGGILTEEEFQAQKKMMLEG